jgi:hypothetical protein
MDAARVQQEQPSAGTKEPRVGRQGAHSGRLLLRMPEPLHAELAKVSHNEGVSLNTFITDVLASAVGWRSSGVRPRGRTRPEVQAAPADRTRRLLPTLLVANLVVVSAVGIVAIVLLVQALR